MNKRADGKAGEDLAVDFLLKKGYRILQRNYRFERGEIDIIAVDGDELVFVEVKARRSSSFGDPEDAVSPAKCEQIKRVAEGFLLEHDIDGKPVRFDVVAVLYERNLPIVRHLEDAF